MDFSGRTQTNRSPHAEHRPYRVQVSRGALQPDPKARSSPRVVEKSRLLAILSHDQVHPAIGVVVAMQEDQILARLGQVECGGGGGKSRQQLRFRQLKQRGLKKKSRFLRRDAALGQHGSGKGVEEVFPLQPLAQSGACFAAHLPSVLRSDDGLLHA